MEKGSDVIQMHNEWSRALFEAEGYGPAGLGSINPWHGLVKADPT